MDTPPFLNYLFQLNLFSSENSILSLQTFHVLNFPFYMMLGKYQQQNVFLYSIVRCFCTRSNWLHNMATPSINRRIIKKIELFTHKENYFYHEKNNMLENCEKSIKNTLKIAHQMYRSIVMYSSHKYFNFQ